MVLAVPGRVVFSLAFRLDGVWVLVGMVIALLWLLAVVVVVTALTGIYQAALYQFLNNRRTPEAFATTDSSHAFSAWSA